VCWQYGGGGWAGQPMSLQHPKRPFEMIRVVTAEFKGWGYASGFPTVVESHMTSSHKDCDCACYAMLVLLLAPSVTITPRISALPPFQHTHSLCPATLPSPSHP
jgi:hypothetical protein